MSTARRPEGIQGGLAAGLPAVAFDQVSGVEELIKQGKTGLLAGQSYSVEEFARSLSKLMSAPQYRLQLGQQARKYIDNWAPEKVFRIWENLIISCQIEMPRCKK